MSTNFTIEITQEDSMLYLGFFSFTAKDLWDKKIFGHFCCLVEADAPEVTEDKFKALLTTYRKATDVFSIFKSIRIEIDSLIEVEKLPTGGSLAFIVDHNVIDKDTVGTILGSLPGNESGLNAYSRTEQDDQGHIVTKPFMEF